MLAVLATATVRGPGHAIPTALLAPAALPVLRGQQPRPAMVSERPRRHRGLQRPRAASKTGLLGLHSNLVRLRRGTAAGPQQAMRTARQLQREQPLTEAATPQALRAGLAQQECARGRRLNLRQAAVCAAP